MTYGYNIIEKIVLEHIKSEKTLNRHLKSTGYCEGMQADMYIYTVNVVKVNHIRYIMILKK